MNQRNRRTLWRYLPLALLCFAMFLTAGVVLAGTSTGISKPQPASAPEASGTSTSNTPTRTSTPRTTQTSTRTRTATSTRTPTITPTPCIPRWDTVNSPSPGSSANVLEDVAVVGQNDVWAVGSTNNTGPTQALIEHWNGSAWSVVSSPAPGTVHNLSSVTALGPNDVWAVGDYAGPHPFSTFILHWNGSAWSVVPSPNQGSDWNILYGIAAISPTDIWAVGYYVYGPPPTNEAGTLILHWNGSIWSIVPSPSVGSHSWLYGIAAAGPNDVWAVGGSRDGSSSYNTLILHWNGSAWSIVPSPNPNVVNQLNDVAVAGPNDAWAVGTQSGSSLGTLILHWNGSAWSVVAGPDPGSQNNDLFGIALAGPNDVWAVGSQTSTPGGGRTLIIHWDGSTWSVVPSSDPPSSRLNGVSTIGNYAWAVGSYSGGSSSNTLTERYVPCDAPSTPLPTSTPISTATPTSTPTPGTYCVSAGGGPTGLPCSNPTAFTSLQAAIDVAFAGSEVRVANGAYYGTGNAVGIVSRPITITGGYAGGTSGWVTPGPYTGTAINGEGVRNAFQVQPGVTASVNNLSIVSGGIKSDGATKVDFSTLSVNGVATFSGSFLLAAGTLFDFNCICTLASGISITGQGTARSAYFTTSLDVPGGATMQNLNLASGAIAGAGTLTVTGVLSWTGGSMTGAGITYLPPSAQANIAYSTGYIQIDGRTVNNAGTATWFNAGPFYIYTGGAFNNNGAFEARNTLSFAGSSTGTFNNTAMFRKAADVGNVDVSTGVAFNSSGTIEVPNSTLTLSTNNNMAFTLLAGSQVTGAGFLRVASSFAQVNIAGPTTAQNLNLAGGTLGGAGTLTVTGVLSWTGGNMAGAGVTYIPPSALVDIAFSTAYIVLDGRTVSNAGTATWRNAGPFYVRNGGVFNNTGLFEAQNTLYFGDSGGAFNNSGTLRKAAGYAFTGANTIPLNNQSSGVIEVYTGTMSLPVLNNLGGAIELYGGTLTSYAPINIRTGALRGTGTVSGELVSGGNVSPGLSPGVITGTNSYTQYLTGTLNVELAGLTPGTQYDQLKVTGAASLNGTLNISSINGFVPQVGNSFVIMTYGSHTGAFSNVSTGCSGTTWSVTYNANNVTITATGAGPQCTPTPTPTTVPTTVPIATATRTAISTATPAPCAGFSDLPPDSTFYPFATCLVSRGIVAGYNDCTFRPNNNVTRGQLSKIVALAANFTDPPGSQMFRDVAPGSTFYDFVQNLASRNIIGGYACGGPNEPCVAPGNLPYFRPGANATRGQISKIVSNAANFTDPPGSQMFRDVAPGSTFYDFVQRLANRGVMSGYPCGGAGEPCVSPGNLPYFRPSNNATRGQVSKIVANTFFPNCRP